MLHAVVGIEPRPLEWEEDTLLYEPQGLLLMSYWQLQGAPTGQRLTSLVPGCDPVENDHTLHTYTHYSHIPLDSRKVLDGECITF